MNLTVLVISVVIFLLLAYYYYAQFIAKIFNLNDKTKTPAHIYNDDQDFVPTNKFYLFAQHFSAIAAAGPIAGPIIACTNWGWLPCLIWISLGVVLIGAVHDFSSLIISVRHHGVSIAQITKNKLGNKAGIAMMIFIWLALIYVIIAFVDITAATFVGESEELTESKIWFNKGGAVGFCAVTYLLISLFMGLIQHYFKPSLFIISIIFVPLAFLSILIGTEFSHILTLNHQIWSLLIILYCFFASLSPLWLLLQPRGYLGGFFLYAVILVGIIGIFFGDFTIKQPIFSQANNEFNSSIFPFLFVTIACGACSGFHGLVCSGTTSKQIDKETHSKTIGYGAMLAEGFIAIIALSSIMILSTKDIENLKPGAIYAKGIGEFLSIIISKKYLHIASTFGAMAFSTFVFDTLDVATRLGRYILEELLSLKSTYAKIIATLATLILPCVFIFFAQEGAYLQFWTLFGASNQLLAALTLLLISVWLYQSGKKIFITLIPMIFILTTTFYALVKIIQHNYFNKSDFLSLSNSIIAGLLILLAIYLLLSTIITIKKK